MTIYTNIQNDIYSYESGKLVVTLKSSTKHWQEERRWLQKLYTEKHRELLNLQEYVAELELTLTELDLEPLRIAKREIESETGSLP